MTTDHKKSLIRLNVLIQEHGVASRRKADELIRSGAVTVNGSVVNTLGIQVEKKSTILINGKPIQKAPSKVTYLFHKPPLTLTTRHDEQNRPTIFDLPMLRSLPANVQAVGRLDFKSEGLLLLTNDGDLALTLSHPKYSVEKNYAVLVSSAMTGDEIEKLRKGVELDDGLAKPVSVKQGNREKLGSTSGQWVEIVVAEGRNRLVRRMLEALGLKVMRLVRVGIGNLKLPIDLPSGKIRPATEYEKKYLKEIKKNLTQDATLIKKSTPRRKKNLSDMRYLKKTIKTQKNNTQKIKERKLKIKTAKEKSKKLNAKSVSK